MVITCFESNFQALIINIYSKFYQHINKGIKIETDK